MIHTKDDSTQEIASHRLGWRRLPAEVRGPSASMRSTKIAARFLSTPFHKRVGIILPDRQNTRSHLRNGELSQLRYLDGPIRSVPIAMSS